MCRIIEVEGVSCLGFDQAPGKSVGLPYPWEKSWSFPTLQIEQSSFRLAASSWSNELRLRRSYRDGMIQLHLP